MKALIGCGTVVGVMLLVLLIGGGIYGKVVSLRNSNEDCNGAFAQVDNMLERKIKLIPNLMETVKGMAKHEQAVVDNVTKARAAMMSASTPVEKAQFDELGDKPVPDKAEAAGLPGWAVCLIGVIVILVIIVLVVSSGGGSGYSGGGGGAGR